MSVLLKDALLLSGLAVVQSSLHLLFLNLHHRVPPNARVRMRMRGFGRRYVLAAGHLMIGKRVPQLGFESRALQS